MSPFLEPDNRDGVWRTGVYIRIHSGPGAIFLIQGASWTALLADEFGGNNRLSVISHQSSVISHQSSVADRHLVTGHGSLITAHQFQEGVSVGVGVSVGESVGVGVSLGAPGGVGVSVSVMPSVSLGPIVQVAETVGVLVGAI